MGLRLKRLSNEIHPAHVVWEVYKDTSQDWFIRSPFWETFYTGNRGPGKTDALLMKFAQHVGKGWGRSWRGVIFRRQYKNLDEVKVKGKKFFFPAFQGCRFLESKSDYKFVWPDGEELLLRAIKDDDDYWDYHGHEYPFIAFDELTTWPTDFLYTSMKSCSRSTAMGIPRCYCATSNPYGPGHGWVKRYWYDPAPGYEPTGHFIRDPRTGMIRARYAGDLLENKKLLDASPEYLHQLDSIESEALRMAWRFGSWDIAIGGFWDGVWDPAKHIVDRFIPPVQWRHWRALDWGYARPYSVGWYAMSPEGQIVKYRELYGWGGRENVGSRESVTTVAKQIIKADEMERKYGCRFMLNPADSQIWASEGTETNVADLFRKHQVVWHKASKGPGSRVNGWNALREVLEHRIPLPPHKGGGVVPGFVVTKNCRHFLRTFPTLMPDEDDWEDIDTDQEDHCFAADTEIIATNTHVYSLGRWRRYRNPRLTRRNALLLRLRFSDGSEVRCTPNHRFWTRSGWVEAGHLNQKTLSSCPLPDRISEGCVTTFAAITLCAPGAAIKNGFANDCTEPCGYTTTDRSQTGVISTIGTTIRRIIGWTTSIWSMCQRISPDTSTSSVPPANALHQEKAPAERPQNGTGATKAASGTAITTSEASQPRWPSVYRKLAKSVVVNIRRRRFMRTARSIAGTTAKPLHCVAVEVCGRADVYCLTVPSVGAFTLLNGATVSNCADETRYSIFARHKAVVGPKPGEEDTRFKQRAKELPRPRIKIESPNVGRGRT